VVSRHQDFKAIPHGIEVKVRLCLIVMSLDREELPNYAAPAAFQALLEAL
jgi:hypothetical protein